MQTQSGTEKNSATPLTPAIQSGMPWRVTTVQALPDFRLHVRFVDSTQGIVDLSGFVHSDNAGVFAVLTDPAMFEQVFVEHGAVTWPGEIDLAPDAMYARIRQAQTAS
jgi:hypothetical protein